MIRGEYWIQGGRVDFADGDVGERNHEMIATDHVCSQHLESLHAYGTSLGLKLPASWSMEDEPTQSAQGLISAIINKLFSETEPGNDKLPLFKNQNEIWSQISKSCNIDMETLLLIMQDKGSIDPRLYVMKREGWIAVRNDNIELFGYDEKKRKELTDGIEEILDEEGIEESDEEIQFNLYDHKTGRSSDITLADIKTTTGLRPHNLPNTTYNRAIVTPVDRPKSIKPMSAITRSMMQTSEASGFKAWLRKDECIIRRAWPNSGFEESPKNQSLNAGRRRNRRLL